MTTIQKKSALPGQDNPIAHLTPSCMMPLGI